MDLEKRMASLEKQVRLYKRLGLLAVVVMAGSLIAGAAAPTPQTLKAKTITAESIIAEEFRLKPLRGKNYISGWGMTDDGPKFFMADGKLGGDIRQIFLNLDSNGAAMGISDANGKGRIGIHSGKAKSTGKEYPTIILSDKDGNAQVTLLALDRENAGVAFADSSGQVRATTGMRENEEPHFALYDEEGKLVWSMPPK